MTDHHVHAADESYEQPLHLQESAFARHMQEYRNGRHAIQGAQMLALDGRRRAGPSPALVRGLPAFWLHPEDKEGIALLEEIYGWHLKAGQDGVSNHWRFDAMLPNIPPEIVQVARQTNRLEELVQRKGQGIATFDVTFDEGGHTRGQIGFWFALPRYAAKLATTGACRIVTVFARRPRGASIDDCRITDAAITLEMERESPVLTTIERVYAQLGTILVVRRPDPPEQP